MQTSERLARTAGWQTMLMAALFGLCTQAHSVDKLSFHHDSQRSGWNAQESLLTPQAVAGGRFGQLWQSPPFDAVDGQAPRLFATPLFVQDLALTAGPHAGQRLSVVYASTDVGWVYAVNAAATPTVPAGTILWRKRLGSQRPPLGNLSTPVIDLARQRLYVVSADGETPYRVHALDLRSGEEHAGWPAVIDAKAVNGPGINRNGSTRFPQGLLIQRGALALSADASRLYVPFAEGDTSGWLVAVDTRRAAVATAFSATARPDEVQGGMWAAGGAAVDAEGYVHIATGASVQVHLKKLGIAGVFAGSAGNWGQSVLRLADDSSKGFELRGTYSPFNYAQAQATDIDLGSSGTTLIDIDPTTTSTPKLLVVGGKQGNVVLLDRAHMPGSLVKRPAPGTYASSDGSLLSPEIQPQFGTRGPINVFGPYADHSAMNDQARSRSTPAAFRSSGGQHHVLVTGSAKTGKKLDISTPPGLVRLQIVTATGQPAYLQVAQREMTQTFHNPGSPVVSSNAGDGAVVWVLDTNARRTAPLHGPAAPRPVLYAFDALSLALLWKSAPGELATSGKYNEATVVGGQVIVGTDRIQAFGLRSAAQSPRVFASPFEAWASAAPVPVVVAARLWREGEALYAQRCAACHSSGQAGPPARATLSLLPAARIEATLRNGVMQPQAAGLADGELRALAAYLTGTPAPARAD